MLDRLLTVHRLEETEEAELHRLLAVHRHEGTREAELHRLLDFQSKSKGERGERSSIVC